MKKDFSVLFFGDIVGRPGRKATIEYLNLNKAKYDFVIANVENASHGFGLTKKNHDELLAAGINCMTSGNHIWDKKDIFTYIADSEAIIRPLNYHESVQGVGYRLFIDDKVLILNLLGKTFMNTTYCPFLTLQNLAEKINFSDKIVILDFHAEATAEKECMGMYAQSLGVKAVLGTHTHVQTADEKIINNTCAYITDVGYVGGSGGVIGMDYEISLKRIISQIPERFDVVNSKESVLNAINIVFDIDSCIPKSITRIFERYNEVDNEA